MGKRTEKDAESFRWFINKITRPLTQLHILLIVLFCIYVFISIYWIFFTAREGVFWLLLGSLSVVTAIITVMILFSKFAIYRIFSKHRNNFAYYFKSGFMILFMVGIIRIVMDITNSFIRNYWLPHVFKQLGMRTFETWSMTWSVFMSMINLILAGFILLAYYRFVSGLRYYSEESSGDD